ncbi:MAG: DUF402 domain-containing protein [Microbacterium sp.]
MSITPRIHVQSAPEGAWDLGQEPFLAPGDQIDWHYRRKGWREGDSGNIVPMRVVRDDARGLVAWLAPGTRIEDAGGPNGEHIRFVPLEERWKVQRTRIQERWFGGGILRIAPVGKPWSVWLFRDGDEASGWYVNLESAHLRSGSALYSGDHVLDVWIEPDGTIHMKDEDELVAAVEQGKLTETEADQIRANGEAAIASFQAGDWPFDDEWWHWRPDPQWTTPDLAWIDELPEATRPREQHTVTVEGRLFERE